MANKTHDEQIAKIDQKMNELRNKKKRLEKEKAAAVRKQRDHMLCRLSATLLTRFPKDVEQMLIDSSDQEIDAWVRSLEVSFRSPTERPSEVPMQSRFYSERGYDNEFEDGGF